MIVETQVKRIFLLKYMQELHEKEWGKKMDTDKLEMFVRAARLKSITDAAQSLQYTQSGASHMLQSLEEELGGVTLLARSRRGVELTAVGQRLLPLAQEILYWSGQLVQTVDFLQGTEMGLLRVGGFTSAMTLWLPSVLKALREKYPNVQLETMRASYEDVERWVRTGQVDCGFCRLPVHTGLKSYFLADDPLVVITPPNHRLREKEVISYSDLDGEDFIRPTQDRFNDVASLLALSNVTLHFPHMVHDYHEVITSVASGLGISIVPAMMMKMYAFSVSVHQLEDHPHRRIGLVVRNEKNISPITKAFIEITQKLFEDGTLG